jgi:hypothetical protein
MPISNKQKCRAQIEDRKREGKSARGREGGREGGREPIVGIASLPSHKQWRRMEAQAEFSAAV